jgi:hypothetical protein
MRLVVLLLIAVVSVYCSNATSSLDSNQILWNKYRHQITSILSQNYCAVYGLAYPCWILYATVFQIVDEPRDALWHENRYWINEDVCSFVPAWRTTFRPRCMGIDCTFGKAYENAIKAIPNAAEAAQAFLKFARTPTESFNDPRPVAKSYPWYDDGGLAAFTAYAQSLPHDTFSFEMDRNTPIELTHNAWGTCSLLQFSNTI